MDRMRRPDIQWNWNEVTYNPPWHEAIFELMDRYVPRGKTILEVGAGGSHTLAALAGRSKCRAVGLEPDPDGALRVRSLAHAEKANVEMVRGDGFGLPFADDSFDVVYSLGLIEHFEPDETQTLIAEHVRVCKRDGIVIIAVPNFLNLPHTISKYLQGKRYPYFPERSYRPGKLAALMKAAGLRIEAMDGVAPLWGVGMIEGGWRVIAALDRLHLSKRIGNLKRSRWRAAIGYMTYAVARKGHAD